MSQSSWITRQHYTPTPDLGFKLLWPFLGWASLEYKLAISLRNCAYDRGLIPIARCQKTPVISIGNLTTGGTGKTPVIKALAEALSQQHGFKVVILTRGYGATQPLSYGQPTQAAHGDEAFWLQQHLPNVTVIVGTNRATNALRAESDYQPDVILLDDGFQHRRLHRDMDVVLIDAKRGLGNGHCLPFGPLREPPSSLRRATHIAHTKGAFAPKLNQLFAPFTKNKPTLSLPFSPTGALNEHDEKVALDKLPKRVNWVLISGIAHPSDFETQVTEWMKHQSGKLLEHHAHADHATYSPHTITHWEASAQQHNAYILTTEKDWSKIQPHVQSPHRWYRWHIEADVTELTPHVINTIQACRNRQASGLHRNNTPRVGV